MSKWAFELGDKVKLLLTEERGTVKARAEYSDGIPDSYYILYRSADGRQVHCWWNAAELVKDDAK